MNSRDRDRGSPPWPTMPSGLSPPPPEANGLGRYMAHVAGELMARMHHNEQSHAEHREEIRAMWVEHRAEMRERWAEQRGEMREVLDRLLPLEVKMEILEDSREEQGHTSRWDEAKAMAKNVGTACRWLLALVLSIAYMAGMVDLATVQKVLGLGSGGH